jgi:hypothetical protein
MPRRTCGGGSSAASTAWYSLDDGRYYVAQQGTVVEEDGVTKQTGLAQLHRWTGKTPAPFERVH